MYSGTEQSPPSLALLRHDACTYTELLRTHMQGNAMHNEKLDPHLTSPYVPSQASGVQASVEYISSVRTAIPSITTYPICELLSSVESHQPTSQTRVPCPPTSPNFVKTSHPISHMRAKRSALLSGSTFLHVAQCFGP